MKQLIEVLEKCREYLDRGADADHNGLTYIPNEEMKLMVEINLALASYQNTLPAPQQMEDAADEHLVKTYKRLSDQEFSDRKNIFIEGWKARVKWERENLPQSPKQEKER